MDAQLPTPPSPRRLALDARIAERRARKPRFTPAPARTRLSTRGEPGKPWCTKRHTASRTWPVKEADKSEAQKAREKRRSDAQGYGLQLIHTLYARVG